MNAAVTDHYAREHQNWHWQVPAEMNVAQLCAHRWSRDPIRAVRPAIIWEDEDGASDRVSFASLSERVERFAAALSRLGVGAGDSVAVCLPQRIETAVSLLAVMHLGAIAVPLTVLFGPDALEYRLGHAKCKVAIADGASLANVLAVRARVPTLATVIACAGARDAAALDWDTLLAAETSGAPLARTRATDAAVIIYTSGTTGPPKGALIPHQAMYGNSSGFIYSHNLFPQRGDVFWSPADWAWTGGLWDALLPTLFFGHTLIGYRGRFDPERAFALMERHKVTCSFLFPTALKMMMKAVPRPRDRFDLRLRSIMSAGESVGETVFRWVETALGVTPNEMFGQTELNYVVGNCAAMWPARPGSMGRAYPGHQVAVIDAFGRLCPVGETGDVAVNRRDIHGDLDPVFFLGYLGNEAGTRAKYEGDWCRTGDMAHMDADGYLWYQGRSDDVIKSAGYRIGPSEVENCLVQHPAVAMAAVIGKPDRERGAIVKAFIVLAAGHQANAELEADLAKHVRGKLAPYEYPKEFEFVTELPMTTTGKIQRKVLRDREAERGAR
ncbi:MAG: AMP-binding protein [Burkholderiales bacterium]|nr:AMP-binding protein [Pseudomonadota bacterium]MCC7067127.1 AMP-binding protein [Burkholderiales bacterium]